MLIGNVMNVNIEIPKVVRGNFEEDDEDKNWIDTVYEYILSC